MSHEAAQQRLSPDRASALRFACAPARRVKPSRLAVCVGYPLMSSERYPKFYRLLAHPFTLEVLEDANRVFEIGSTETGQPFSTSPVSEAFPAQEFVYYYNVFIYLSNLVRTVERMEQVPIYLRRFPNSKYFAEHNITLPTWMGYHYANFVIMNVSLYDIRVMTVRMTH